MDYPKLWTASEVAHIINRSDREVREFLRYQDDFPIAIVLPSKGKQAHPQWVPQEVYDWALKQRDPARRKPMTRN